MSDPKVSIIMPSLNVAPYIKECMDSIVNQTLSEIEIICVDAGSNDGTRDILQEYADHDERIIIIDSAKKSYGYQVNAGIDCASGLYIGIIETDDFAEKDMFEKLYNDAVENDLDACKAGFYFYWSKPEIKNEPYPVASDITAGRVFCPLTDFSAPLEKVEFFNIKPSIWSAIYKRSFLSENGIRLSETPGASFQDTAFNFKVWALAKRVKLLNECVLHYRQDNEQSSVNNPGKVFCICDEYEIIDKFLDDNPELKGRLEGVKVRLKYDAYIWNCNRLDASLRAEFLKRISREFYRELEMGNADRDYFITYKWKAFHLIIKDPDRFLEGNPELTDNIIRLDNENGSKAQRIIKNLKGAVYCIKDHGLKYTVKLALEKYNEKQNS